MASKAGFSVPSSLAALQRRGIFLAALSSLGLLACTPKVPAAAVDEATRLVQRGRVVYQTNCTACHASNPKIRGSVGPEIAGASLELLNSRVLTQGYPPGYKPKRETQVMPALPHLAKDIPALHAFLNAP